MGKRRLLLNLVLQVFAMLGIGLLVYPTAANWFSALGHNAEISGYLSSVAALSETERSEKLSAADAYNAVLEPGELTDPFLAVDPDEAQNTPLFQAYRELLRVTGTEAIGEVTYPRLGIALPIYHGTSDTVISKGVGHLFGSSLPVGGPTTHAVMTSHSGLPNATLFTRLLEAVPGDTFTISVLGEAHNYRVDSVETVTPEATDSLTLVPGKDLVTLFTCAPIGINSHRFMVHAERIPMPEGAGSQVIAGDGLTAGFPWWALWFVGGSGAVAWLLFAPPRRKRREAGGA